MTKTCSNSDWHAKQVLKRINAEIEAKRSAGEDLPPPPKTAIAGPEYFGLNSPEIVEQIELLDPTHLCATYWLGKQVWRYSMLLTTQLTIMLLDVLAVATFELGVLTC